MKDCSFTALYLACYFFFAFNSAIWFSRTTTRNINSVFVWNLNIRRLFIYLENSEAKWHPLILDVELKPLSSATLKKRTTDLDRTDDIQRNKVENRSFLAPEWLKNKLKFLVVQNLFPRARLLANMNINFKKIHLKFKWIWNFERRRENCRKALRLLSIGCKTKYNE